LSPDVTHATTGRPASYEALRSRVSQDSSEIDRATLISTFHEDRSARIESGSYELSYAEVAAVAHSAEIANGLTGPLEQSRSVFLPTP